MPALSTLSNDSWITSTQLADLAGINTRNAILAMNKGTWRHCELNVKQQIGATGGNKGVVNLVHVDSLPANLRDKYYLSQTTEVTIKQTLDSDSSLSNSSYQRRMKVALWRFELIRDALVHSKRSPQRAAAVGRIDGRSYMMPGGKQKKVTRDMVYRWIKAYEAEENISALMPQVNAFAGQKKNFIRKVDKMLKSGELTPGQHAAIEGAVERYVKSLWAQGADGWRSIADYATVHLQNLLNEIPVPSTGIEVTRAYVERFRTDYKIVAIHDNDAKLFFDKYIPRIMRHNKGIQPLDIVVGDVHPIDIKCHRPDGSIVYPRAIGWHDVATGRVWFTLIMCQKGEGVRREHIAMSFASLCEAWGLPKRLYLDNGNEYNWKEMLDGFMEIADLTQNAMALSLMEVEPEFQRIIRSRPYNAPAKAIEGLFSVIEQYFSQIQGWTGGDRQRQKTHNVGKEPIAFSGDFEAFHRAVDVALDRYHKREQSALENLSPNQLFNRFVRNGWQKIAVDQNTLLFAFAQVREGVKIDRGYISVNSIDYYHDNLLPYSGRKCTIRIPKHDPTKVLVFVDGRNLTCIAEPAPVYGVLETAGAKEQNRRAKLLRRVISERRQHCDRLNLLDEMARWNETKESAVEAPVCQVVTLAKDSPVQQMVAAIEAEKTEIKSKKSSTKLDQFMPDSSNPLLDAIDWDDDEEEM